jgi:hypothetical protein
MNRKKIGYEGMNWICLAQDNQWRVVFNREMNFPCSIKDRELLDHLSDYSVFQKVSVS